MKSESGQGRIANRGLIAIILLNLLASVLANHLDCEARDGKEFRLENVSAAKSSNELCRDHCTKQKLEYKDDNYFRVALRGFVVCCCKRDRGRLLEAKSLIGIGPKSKYTRYTPLIRLF